MAKEDNKGQSNELGLFRACVYLSVLLELVMFAPSEWVSGMAIILDRFRSLAIYQDIFLSKGATLLIVAITSIGTRPKKSLKFDIRKMVYLPAAIAIILLLLSVAFQKTIGTSSSGFVAYAVCSFMGAILAQTALDSLSKIKIGRASCRERV